MFILIRFVLLYELYFMNYKLFDLNYKLIYKKNELKIIIILTINNRKYDYSSKVFYMWHGYCR